MSSQKKSSSNKPLIYTSIGLVSVLLVVFALKQFDIIGESGTEIEVEVQTSKYATIIQQVSASGKIQFEVEVII
jgi:HlyD family secretion protein